jgi:hypothetical protein
MSGSVKCAWCGGTFPLTAKGRPKQHLNGAQVCVGSGQLAATHNAVRAANERPTLTPKPKRK